MSISMIRTAAAVAVLSLAALSDARAQETFTSTDPLTTATAAPKTAGTVVELDEAALSEGSVYQLLTRRHAGWLASRGPFEYPQRAGVVVYLDGVAIGNKSVLRQIPVSRVAEIRRYDAVEAGRELGFDHGAGAILLTSK